MEPINNGGSVACRNPHECRQRIDDADRVSGTEALALYAEQTGFDA
jgi:hypothetical protein